MLDNNNGGATVETDSPAANAPPQAAPVAAPPDVSNLPAVTRPPMAPPQGDPVNTRHSLIGRAIEHAAHAIEGKQVVGYQPDANGDLQTVVGPRKPGGIFRDILIG